MDTETAYLIIDIAGLVIALATIAYVVIGIWNKNL